MNEHVERLTTCPVSDINFKNHLEAASAQDVREALEFVTGLPFSEAKEVALRAELKKKEE